MVILIYICVWQPKKSNYRMPVALLSRVLDLRLCHPHRLPSHTAFFNGAIQGSRARRRFKKFLLREILDGATDELGWHLYSAIACFVSLRPETRVSAPNSADMTLMWACVSSWRTHMYINPEYEGTVINITPGDNKLAKMVCECIQ